MQIDTNCVSYKFFTGWNTFTPAFVLFTRLEETFCTWAKSILSSPFFFRKGQSEGKSLLSFVKHSWGKFCLLNSYMYCFSPHRHKSFLYADLSTSYFYFLHGDVEPSKPHTGLIQLIKNIKTARKRIIVDVELKT